MVLRIIRGLPGSGKTTLAKQMIAGHEYGFGPFEADQYFERNGDYKFDKCKLKKAHNWCYDQVRATFAFLIDNAKVVEKEPNSALVIVSNTSSMIWEFQPYIDLAQKYNHEISVITCEGYYGSLHNVPLETIAKMRARWEPYS